MNFYLLLVAILAFSTTIDVSEALNCNVRTDAASGDGASTACGAGKDTCISYFAADGKNVGECVAADGACTGKTRCKSCTTADCNTVALINRKCYSRTDDATEGTADTQCTTNAATAKCISYYNAAGKNLGECAVDCTGKATCQSCDTDNCNVKSLVTTTTTAAPTAAPGAGATRASVGWQTGIIAASTCVLVLMKPF